MSNTELSLFEDTDRLYKMQELAGFMAKGTVTLPDHLRNKPSDCFAICLKAATWRMDPYTVAEKTHLVNGKLGYEAQLVAAVLQSSNAIEGDFVFEYGGPWEELERKYSGNNFPPELENECFVKVGATPKGQKEIKWSMPLYLSSVKIRNSPLWKSRPTQQIAYLAQKQWARLHKPSVMLGVYTPDELQEMPAERDITPPKEDINEVLRQKREAKQKESATQEPVSEEVVEAEVVEEEKSPPEKSKQEIYDELIQQMANAKTNIGLFGIKHAIATKLTGKHQETASAALIKRTNQLKPASIALRIERMSDAAEYAAIMEEINTLPIEDAKRLADLLDNKTNELTA